MLRRSRFTDQNLAVGTPGGVVSQREWKIARSSLRNHGQSTLNGTTRSGKTARLDSLQAAALELTRVWMVGTTRGLPGGDYRAGRWASNWKSRRLPDGGRPPPVRGSSTTRRGQEPEHQHGGALRYRYTCIHSRAGFSEETSRRRALGRENPGCLPLYPDLTEGTGRPGFVRQCSPFRTLGPL
jgi:hypothetical protein